MEHYLPVVGATILATVPVGWLIKRKLYYEMIMTSLAAIANIVFFAVQMSTHENSESFATLGTESFTTLGTESFTTLGTGYIKFVDAILHYELMLLVLFHFMNVNESMKHILSTLSCINLSYIVYDAPGQYYTAFEYMLATFGIVASMRFITEWKNKGITQTIDVFFSKIDWIDFIIGYVLIGVSSWFALNSYYANGGSPIDHQIYHMTLYTSMYFLLDSFDRSSFLLIFSRLKKLSNERAESDDQPAQTNEKSKLTRQLTTSRLI